MSSNGSDTAALTPRSMVRREIRWFMGNSRFVWGETGSFYRFVFLVTKRVALHNCVDQCAKMMLVTFHAGDDLSDSQFVVVLQLAAQGIRKHFLGELTGQVAQSFFDNDLFEARRAGKCCSVWKLTGRVDLTASMTRFETAKPVIVFEAETQWINLAVTGIAVRVLAVQL